MGHSDTIFGRQGRRIIDVLAPDVSTPLPLTRRQIRRYLTRLCGALYARRAMQLLKVNSGRAVELAISRSNPERFIFEVRPRCFDRLAMLGEPSIYNTVRRKTEGGRWCRAFPDPEGRLSGILQEPMWRLLDPAPLTTHELDAFDRTLAPRRPRPQLPERGPRNWRRWQQSLAEFRYEADFGKPTEDDEALVCFSQILLELRRASNERDFVRYTAALVSAVEFLSLGHNNRTLVRYLARPFRNEDFALGDYLRRVFGRITGPLTSDDEWKQFSEMCELNGIFFEDESREDDEHRVSLIMITPNFDEGASEAELSVSETESV